MIAIQLFHLSLLLQLIGASLILPVGSTDGTKSEKDSPSSIEMPHAFTKRAYDTHMVEPIADSGAVSNNAGAIRGFCDTSRAGRDRHYQTRLFSQDQAIPNKGPGDEQPGNHQLIYDTFAILQDKEHRFDPSNLKILNQNLKQWASGPLISVPQWDLINANTGFETLLLKFLSKCFEEEKAEWWFQLFDSWHSLNTAFLNEVDIMFKLNHLRKNHLRKVPGTLTKDAITKLIERSIVRSQPKSMSSGVGSSRVREGAFDPMYATINSISPGIWKFSLPTKKGEFDLDMLKRSPIAHLSWFLDDLDPAEMIEYAQAFQKPEGISIPAQMKRQLILEQSDKTEPKQKFAAAKWFVQRVGWKCFQKTMLDFEKFAQKRPMFKVKSSGYYPQRKIKNTRIEAQGLEDMGKKRLNQLLEENQFPLIAQEEQFSDDIMEWLSNLCVLPLMKPYLLQNTHCIHLTLCFHLFFASLNWLKQSKAQVSLLPSWEDSSAKFPFS